MAKVLYIKATPKKTQDSWTLKMSEYFLDEYRRQNPKDTITELSLYDANIAFLNERDLHNMMQEDKGEFAGYVDQFLAHDKYVIAAPFWNHSIPAILRAYIDRIITVGKTFYYTDEGIKPAHVGKKAIFFMARGGFYSEGPLQELEFGVKYWDAVATTFLGIETGYQIIEGTEILPAQQVNDAFKEKLPELKSAAQAF